MIPEGPLPNRLTPTELLAYRERRSPPTGEVNYCAAGADLGIQVRRNEAVAAITVVCGGTDRYRIRREGPGLVKPRYWAGVQWTPSCTNSRAIVFDCPGAQPEPTLRR